MTPYLCFRSTAENQSFTSGYVPNTITKHLYTLLLALLFIIPAKGWGQVSIVSDGLNNSSALFTLSGGGFYTGNSAAGDRPASSPFSFEGTHARGITNGTAILTSSDINTSSFSNVNLTFRLASFSIGSTGNGADAGDIVTVEVSPNGGTNYYSTVRVLGNSNAYWGYSATGTASTAYDGNTTSVDFQPTAGGNRTADGYSTVAISNLPPVTNLRVKITMVNNDAKERWVIDNFKITGTPATTYPEPTNHPTLFSCGTTGTTSIPLTWTDATSGTAPTGYLVKWSSVSYDAIIPPTDGTQEANGAGVQNVASDVQSLSVTGLVPNTSYYFKIWPYTNSGSNINYKTDGTIQQTSCTTVDGPCFTGHAPNFSLSGFTQAGDVDTGGSPQNTIRLASSSNAGSASTVAAGVSAGELTVRFRAKAWSDTENQLTVQVGSQSVLYQSLTTTFEWHEVTFTNVPADPTLTFSTDKEKRLHLGNVEIYCGPLVAPRITVKQNTTNIPNSTGSYSFGNQLVGTSSSPTTFTIKNTGTLDLILGSLSLTGTDLSQFAITQPGSTTVAPNATATFTVTFSPSAAGAKTATVNIPNNTSTSNYTFNVNGTGALNTPPNNATGLNACIGNTQLTLNWTASSGTVPTGYIVYALEGTTAPAMDPTLAGNANIYTANSDFSSATDYGSLGKAVYKGNGTSATIAGLTTGHQYTFKVVSYNGETATGWASGINASGSWNATYTAKVPEVTNLAATVAPTSSSVSWNVVLASSGCYEYLVVANQGAVDFTPSGDGTAYNANTVYSGSNQVVYKGTGKSVTVTGLTEGLQYCYKVFVREVNSNQWSDGVSECQTTGLSYCSNASTNSSDNGITGVEFNTINQTSAATNSYTDFTSVNTTVNIGESYELSVKVKTYSNNTNYIKAWIDWNRNGIFDSGEDYDLGTATIVTGGYTSESPVIVTVPTNAAIGNIRMRVISKEGSAPTPCTNYSYGETEDYTIIVAKPTNAEINVKGGTMSIPSGSTDINGLNNTSFAATQVGSSTADKTFTIENLGQAALLLTGTPIVNLTGDNPNDFTVTVQPAATVAVNGTQTFNIKFNPTTSGVLSAIVSISNSDPTGNENPYTFKIQGAGQCTAAPVITMTPTSGPANTVVTLTSSENDLTGATVKLNGVTLTPESITAGEIKVKIPVGMQDGDLTVRLKTGCVFTQAFDVITFDNAGCEGSSGTVPTDLILYEVYDENGGSGGYVSVYNGTSSAKNLANYDIYRAKSLANANAGTFIQYTYGLTGTIAPGELKIIRVAGPNKCSAPASTGNGQLIAGFNDDDVFRLTNIGGTVVYDEVHSSNRVGYYMKRVADKLGNNPTFDSTSWITTDVGTSDCFPGGVAPALPGGVTPTITTQPDFIPNCQSISLNVIATEGAAGGNGLTYQWYRLAPGETAWSPVSDNTVYSGSASPTLIITDTAGLDYYQYYVQVRENGVTCYEASDAVMIRDSETKWNGGGWSRGVPQPWSKVVIEADYNTKTHGSLTVCELTVNTGNFVIEKNYPVTVEKSVLNNAGDETHFIIENDGQLLQVDDVQNSGKITVKRTMQFTNDRKEYNYLTSPVEGQHMKLLFGAAANTPYVLVLKESTNFFVNAAVSDYQDKGKGFAVKEAVKTYTGSEARFIGKPLNGSFTVHVSRSSASLGWNLIGNPYASNLDLKLLYKQNESKMIPEFRFWDNRSNNTYVQYGGAYNGYSYAFYNALSDVGNPAPGGDTGNNTGTPGSSTPDDGLYRFAKVGQGFIIRAKEEADIAFSNTQRSLNQPDRGFFGKTQNQKDRYRLQLITPSNLYLTNTVVYFEGGNSTYGPEDSRHPSSAATEAFYTLAGTDRTIINGRPLFMDTDVVTLGHKHQVAGIYKIRAINRIGVFAGGQRIYLRDKLLNIVTDLTEGDYSFSTDAGEFTNRFEIVYQPTVVLGSGETALSATVIYRDGEDFVVRSRDRAVEQLEIYDASGRLLLTRSGNSKALRFSASTLSDGVYVVKSLMKGGAVFTQKIRK